ncbi:MAG: hypothetical protein IPN42_05050 [Methylococcaceae bacterium]|nr:hypothetical protein [Methylococcaceae bacterium]
MMSFSSHAVDLQHVAPPAAPAKTADKAMQHDMGNMGMGGGMHHGMGGMGMHQGMGGMHGMMDSMTDEEKEKHLRGMQEHLLSMHDLSNQILAEKDPAKKEQLKKTQLELMKAHHAEMKARHHKMPEPAE